MSEAHHTSVFVDVDGVINADEPAQFGGGVVRRAEVYFDDLGYALRVRWAEHVIDGLREIEALPNVEMVWLTTWTHHASSLLAPKIGIGHDWRYMDDKRAAEGVPRNGPFLNWWKADAVCSAIASGSRVVWLDDDINAWMDKARRLGRTDRLEWMDEARIFIVSPDAKHGLEWEHLDAVKTWITTGERPET